jgi:hypothetical protein
VAAEPTNHRFFVNKNHAIASFLGQTVRFFGGNVA